MQFRRVVPLFASPAFIVVNGSINAHTGMPNSSVYSASKAAILSLVKTLSGELISRGIRLNAVSPGPIETPQYDKLGMPKNSKARWISRNGFPRIDSAIRQRSPRRSFFWHRTRRATSPGRPTSSMVAWRFDLRH